MLTLTNSFAVEGYTVFQDDTNPIIGNRTAAKNVPVRFYVLPQAPSIALDDRGKPIFSLIVYRQDEDRLKPTDAGTKPADVGKEDVGGGILTFTVELGVPTDKLDAITKQLRARTFGMDVSDPNLVVDVVPVPFLDGSVSVAVAGETGSETAADREFVKGAVGTGKVSGIGDNRKAVMVKLTQAGASLMSQLDKLKTLPINVQYDLTFEHRLVGVTMHVWCDITSSYVLIQEVSHTTDDYDDGYWGMSENHVRIDKITSVTETLVRNKTAGVEVIPATSEIEAETLSTLEKFGLDMLNKEIEKAVQASPPPADMDRTYLTNYTSSMGNQFNMTLDRHMVLVRNFRPSANISNVFQGNTFEDLVAFVDLRTAFFSFLKIPIRVNADFKALLIDSVVVTVTYSRLRLGAGSGAREVVTDSFHFNDGGVIQTFLAYANSLDEVTYDWDATVHYKGSTEIFKFGAKKVKDEFLVVDVGKLGMIQVELGFGLVNLDSFPAAKVSFRYRSDSLSKTFEKDFKLSKDTETDVWIEAVHENPVNGYEYKVDWLRKDGDILPGSWTKSSSSRLRFDAPVPDQLKVQVSCSGNFKDGPDQISQIGVSLVYKDPANNYSEEGQLVFTSEGSSQPWVLDLRDANRRDYQYRYTIIYKDGMVKEFPEKAGTFYKGEPGFITVGEKYVIRVEVFPTLLTYLDNAKVVEVDFSYVDPANGVEEHDSLVFTSADNAKKTWRVRGVPGGSKRYTYQVKYFSTTGQVSGPPAVTQDTEVIIIPAAPPMTMTSPGPGR